MVRLLQTMKGYLGRGAGTSPLPRPAVQETPSAPSSGPTGRDLMQRLAARPDMTRTSPPRNLVQTRTIEGIGQLTPGQELAHRRVECALGPMGPEILEIARSGYSPESYLKAIMEGDLDGIERRYELCREKTPEEIEERTYNLRLNCFKQEHAYREMYSDRDGTWWNLLEYPDGHVQKVGENEDPEALKTMTPHEYQHRGTQVRGPRPPGEPIARLSFLASPQGKAFLESERAALPQGNRSQ